MKLCKLVTCNLGSVTPYGATMKDVQCSPKQRMVIKNAYYGDFDQTGVFNDDKSFYATCSALATCRMKPFCNGNISCELTINNTLLPSQHCPDVSKELYTKYNCVDDYSSTPITTGRVLKFFSTQCKCNSPCLLTANNNNGKIPKQIGAATVVR